MRVHVTPRSKRQMTSLSLVLQETLREFWIQRLHGNENIKTTIGLTIKTTTLQVHHTFFGLLFFFFAVFARLRRENA